MNAALGEKHLCVACSAKFYDLNVKPATCPKCKKVQPEAKKKAASGLASAPKKSVPKPKPKLKHEEEVVLGDVVELEEIDDYEDVDHLGEVEEHQEGAAVDRNSDDADDEMFIDELAASDTHLVDEIGEEEAAGTEIEEPEEER